MSSLIRLSVIIPAYNEASRIIQTLETIQDYFRENNDEVEVIVVDDGSRDNTAAIVEQLSERWNQLRLIRNPGNLGKGYSVRNGVLQAKGEIVLFTDADLSAPITETPKLIDPIRRNLCDISFGSRAIDRSLIGVHQSAMREFSGRIFNLLVQMLTGLSFKDTQCGFKAFRREPVVSVFEQQRIMDFGFDPEILYIARKRGLRLLEVPVKWSHVEGTKVHFLKDSIRMFLDLIVIVWNDLTGRYR